MPGYFDSFPVPFHIPATAAPTPGATPKNSKGKGKEKETTAGSGSASTASKEGANGKEIDVVANWTALERDEVERKVVMAQTCTFSAMQLFYMTPLI